MGVDLLEGEIPMEADTYSRTQDLKDAEYAREYREWFASLSPEEQRDLAKRGLDKPSIPGYSSGTGMNRDASEIPVTYDPELGDIEITNTYLATSTEYTMEVIRKFLHELAYQRNPSLTIECFMLVTGVAYNGSSMTAIARKYGITRAAVSKRCIELSDLLGVHASRAMKSEQARKIYSDARIKSLNKLKS